MALLSCSLVTQPFWLTKMGLGKTMQAISTIRLLLCSGELRSVLLVCPKPLVTNWLREFEVWAPEIPVTAIGGSATKREFQWRSPEVPVKVANYELLMRDKETVLDSGLHFDLVALDEAQRIKNRNSTTSEIVRAISSHTFMGTHRNPCRKFPR